MRIIRTRDLVDAASFLTLLPVAWCLPVRSWDCIARWLGRAHVALLKAPAEDVEAVLRRNLGLDLRQVEIGFRAHVYLELLEILREHAPWGLHQRITVAGRHHIDAALAAGKGAVLWYTPFTHADIAFKKGLHQAGYRISHLSSLTHGFSDTRFGLAFLNPLKTRVEARYLKERCVMGRNGVGGVIRSLLERLRANGIVSVTALQSGKRTGERPFLGGTLRLAKGAPNFAAVTGAALLPVFVVPALDGYEVRVEPPLIATGLEVEEAEEHYISAYLPLLERYVRDYPHLWRGWLGSRAYYEPRAAPKVQANDRPFRATI